MIRHTALALLLIVLGSCEQLFIEEDPANDPVTNFDLLWETLDQKYSLFAYKEVDWDSVYNVYRPMVNENTGDVALFDIMAEMLFTLRDGHVNLTSGFDVSRNWDWYLNSPPNFDFNIIERNYLGENHRITGPLRHQVIDSIGYVYYSSFGRTVSNSEIDLVIDRFKDLKGIIFDVRDNGGGSLTNTFRLASRFTAVRQLVYYEEFKNGPGHNDFGDPIPVYVEPAGPVQYTKPVVLLTNRSSYSATTFFASMMSAFPNVTIIGDSTGGGGGTPSNGELPNGWYYRFSATRTIMPNGLNIEGGVPPDIEQDMLVVQAAGGIDSILERALDELE